MKFYRRFKAIKAISFDLDDTLYSNREQMIAADQAMNQYFNQVLPPHGLPEQDYSAKFWWPYRQAVVKQTPMLKHDVTKVREVVYHHGLTALGLADELATKLAKQGLEHFLYQRSNFTVEQATLDFLAQLAQKLPLVAITNGNVDVRRVGLAPYFTHIFLAGDGNLQKPDSDMFNQACQLLDIRPSQLLHVGDCGHADIFGAMRAGCQSAWLNKYDVGKPLKVLPNVEISSVEQLLQLPN
ncbi:HAD-IA family hydrolase [Thalassotalea sp. LPB0316]|uniref:HAD-IA family hydrolase n=1 Tax=Thalassotalea sp. LPB0316 TaxID=2769490 RepID=UPI00186892E8|nr:HAD-IA family hydrolase [Thalassotalea sp. LPB0316]QOL26297.1 HAD-IA family hydrolase [Thalassotalea sp. LPB0316]